jgi:hypothetical protein
MDWVHASVHRGPGGGGWWGLAGAGVHERGSLLVVVAGG